MTTQDLLIEQALGWQVTAQEGEARAGLLRTRRGVIETPVFMPVGTLGTVKGVRFEELEAEGLDARIILGNTYHLWLRPGVEIIAACGGLHRFIGWERALLTDSGGFQVWSLNNLRKISDAGVDRGLDPPELRPDRRADSGRRPRARRRRRGAGGRIAHDPEPTAASAQSVKRFPSRNAGAADVELPTSVAPVSF